MVHKGFAQGQGTQTTSFSFVSLPLGTRTRDRHREELLVVYLLFQRTKNLRSAEPTMIPTKSPIDIAPILLPLVKTMLRRNPTMFNPFPFLGNVHRSPTAQQSGWIWQLQAWCNLRIFVCLWWKIDAFGSPLSTRVVIATRIWQSHWGNCVWRRAVSFGSGVSSDNGR